MMSVSPLVNDAVITRMHMPTAIPADRSTLRRNWRIRLRKAILEVTRALRKRDVKKPKNRLMSIVLA